MDTLKERLQDLRRDKGWTQQDLKDHCEVKLSTIQKIEEGSRHPKLATLAQLAKALEVDPVELFVLSLRTSGNVAPWTARLSSEAIRQQMNEELDLVFVHDPYFIRQLKRIKFIKEWALARILLLRFDTVHAVPELYEAVRYAERSGDSEFYAVTLIDLANAYTIAGDPDAAESWVTSAISSLARDSGKQSLASNARSPRLQVSKARALLIQQEVAFLRGQEDRCRELHKEVQPYLGDDWKDADHCGWAKTYYYLAWMCQHQRKFEEAKEYAQQGLEHANYECSSWWKTNPMWKVRDGVFLNTHWWRLSMTTLLLDILASGNQLHAQEFAECFMSYRQQLNTAFWTNDLPPFRSRYLWLDWERRPELLSDYADLFEDWLVKSNHLGCEHLHTEILVSYGDFLRWGEKKADSARRIYQEVARRSKERKYNFLEQVATQRLEDESLPFPWLTPR